MISFRPNLPQPVTEQDLIALHLNELGTSRARAVRRSIAEDPALAVESGSIAAALVAVTLNARPATRSSLDLDPVIVDRNWQAVRSQLRPYSPKTAPTPGRWWIPALAACLVLATAVCVVYLSPGHRSGVSNVVLSSRSTGTGQDRSSPANLAVAGSNTPADLSPTEPSFRADPALGVYRPRTLGPNGPIRLIAPAFSNSPAEVALPPRLTLLPAPILTPEAQPALVAADTRQDHAQSQLETGQDINSSKAAAKTAGSPRAPHPFDVMLGVGGTFIPQHNSLTAGFEPQTLSVSSAAAAILSLHQQLRPAVGYRVTLSYTRQGLGYTYSSPNATPTSGFYDAGTIGSRVFEAAGTYVFQGPHHKRLTTSADAGAALLAFVPSKSAEPNASYGYRGAAVLGVDVDYAITKHVGARLGYRAQLFRAPGFHYSGGSIPVTTPFILDNQPSLGVTYTFGKR